MSEEEKPSAHQPVLYHEVLETLRPEPGARYLDGTVGLGGHARGILNASSPNGQLVGLDVDPQALELAAQRLDEFGSRVGLRHGSYGQLAYHLAAVGWDSVNGILLDLGASSIQFDRADRGLSFQKEGPLDMRFDPGSPLTADELVNQWLEADLADTLFRYGEEPKSRHIARAIVRARPLHSTMQLADVIAKAVGGRRGGFHPATRSFQALRIAVNKELETLEDRTVKLFFRQESRDCICPPEQLVCTCGHKASIELISRRPIRPMPDEIEANPRARSARLRVAEKL